MQNQAGKAQVLMRVQRSSLLIEKNERNQNDGDYQNVQIVIKDLKRLVMSK